MLPVRHRVTESRDAPNAMSLYSKTDAIAARQRNDAMGHNPTLHGARDHKHPSVQQGPGAPQVQRGA